MSKDNFQREVGTMSDTPDTPKSPSYTTFCGNVSPYYFEKSKDSGHCKYGLEVVCIGQYKCEQCPIEEEKRLQEEKQTKRWIAQIRKERKKKAIALKQKISLLQKIIRFLQGH